ncbi:MAG TPA: DUF4126 domain-containing protein [Gemmatimonadales bacterium]|nr:DUF4126 domain-containing protein [Gemmatimonadales bacterium]
MSPLQTLGFALGTSFASGLNLYATVATAGLLQYFGIVQLPPSLAILAQPVVWGLALGLFAIEFVADKIPAVDSVWDAIHTFIRPPAAALISYSAFGNVPEGWKIGAALLAGSVALTSHGAKATTRAAANTSPEPFSNWALSLFEDAVAITLSWLATVHPIISGAIAVVLVVVCAFVIWALLGFFKRVFAWLKGGPVVTAPSS